MNPILNRFGITGNLGKTFEDLRSTTLSLDADGVLYESCFNVVKLETAIRRARLKILELQFLTKCSFVRAHLTARGSHKAGRKLIIGAKGPYQGNRTTPKPPLLEPLREAMCQPGVFDEDDGVSVHLHRDIEADDAIMMDSYSIPDLLVWSPDKDLRICPAPWYDTQTGRIDRIKDRYGWAKYDEGLEKVVGHGTAFFWAQMLMGDDADHIRGLQCIEVPVKPKRKKDPPSTRRQPVGPAKAGEVITLARTEDDAANAVLDLYRAIGQSPLPEACMLWLLRTPEDTAEGYIWSLNLSTENRAFIQECFNQTYRKEEVQDDGEG